MLSDLGLLAFFYSQAFDRNDKTSVFVISLIGLTLSVLWMLITIVTSRWIAVWRGKIVHLERYLVRPLRNPVHRDIRFLCGFFLRSSRSGHGVQLNSKRRFHRFQLIFLPFE